RLAGSLGAALIFAAGVGLAASAERERRTLQMSTLLVGIVAAVECGWAWLDPTAAAVALNRTIVLLVILGLGSAAYGVGLRRLLPHATEWIACARQLGSILGIGACLTVLVVLTQEMLLYQPAIRRAPLEPLAITAVAVIIACLIATGITFAVASGRDPWNLSERGRRGYVYAAEGLLFLLFLHLRLTVPGLFHPQAGKYWTLIVMGVAFLGVGLSQFFQRRQMPILAEPIRRTGIFLPLLPLLAFWLKPPLGLAEAIQGAAPGMETLLVYLMRLEQDFSRYAFLWFLLGGL